MSAVSLFSSLEHYLSQNPKAQVPYLLMDHELQHLQKREQLSQLISLGSVVLAVLSAVVGIFGGHAFIIGTFCTLAALTWGYAYGCRLAEMNLRDRLTHWVIGGKEALEASVEETPVKEESLIPDPISNIGARVTDTFNYFFK